MQLCQRLDRLLARLPGRTSASPYAYFQLYDPDLPRDPVALGRVFRIKAFVRENLAQGKRLGDHDRRGWCRGKSERTPWNCRLDAEEKVRGLPQCGSIMRG